MLAITESIGHQGSLGTLRELFFVTMLQNAGHRVQASLIGDFVVEDQLFEIGGKNKGRRQLKGAITPAFVVKDDILTGNKWEIPLYYFGLLY
jgi:hypothetical protein